MTGVPLPRFAAEAMTVTLAEQFPGWDIVLSPLGMWNADWHSADGHASHYVIAFTAGQLAGASSAGSSPRTSHDGPPPRTCSVCGGVGMQWRG